MLLSPGQTRMRVAVSWLPWELHDSFLQLSTLGPNERERMAKKRGWPRALYMLTSISCFAFEATSLLWYSLENTSQRQSLSSYGSIRRKTSSWLHFFRPLLAVGGSDAIDAMLFCVNVLNPLEVYGNCWPQSSHATLMRGPNNQKLPSTLTKNFSSRWE